MEKITSFTIDHLRLVPGLYVSRIDQVEGPVNWEIGLASTMAIVFAIFVMVLTVIQTVATRDKEAKSGK